MDTDIIDNRFNIRIPKKLQVMSLNSFVLEAEDGSTLPQGKGSNGGKRKVKIGDDFDEDNFRPRAFRMHQVEFDHGYPIYAKVNMQIYQKGESGSGYRLQRF
jgi:hypothetical protein